MVASAGVSVGVGVGVGVDFDIGVDGDPAAADPSDAAEDPVAPNPGRDRPLRVLVRDRRGVGSLSDIIDPDMLERWRRSRDESSRRGWSVNPNDRISLMVRCAISSW